MKKILILFLQTVIICFGVVVFMWMLWEPQFEGRNIGATWHQIYFHDPFLIYVYLSSIPFFVALYNSLVFLNDLGKNRMSSPHSIRALQTIRRCALSLVVLVGGAEIYFFVFQRGTEDIAGGVALGGLMILTSLIVAAVSHLFAKRLTDTLRPESGSVQR